MRRTSLTLALSAVVALLALAGPAFARSDRSVRLDRVAVERATVSADGALAVAGASGTITIQGRGIVFGQVSQGAITILDFRPDDPNAQISVQGKAKLSWGVAVYSGTGLRFLVPSGRYTIRLVGVGLDASAVGKGSVSALGAGTANDGSVAVNGGRPTPLSLTVQAFVFGPAPSASTSAVVVPGTPTTPSSNVPGSGGSIGSSGSQSGGRG